MATLTPATDSVPSSGSFSTVAKSSTATAPTVVESSEEFTLSGDFTMTPGDEPLALQLSNMAIVEEHQQQSSGKVQFAPNVTIIPDKNDNDNDQIQSQDIIWWSQEELEAMELNATYTVKESQQYQEEVICTVLYNKAYLSAANLAKSITEEELHDRLKNVTDHSNTLETWTAVGHSRRGLENMVSDKAIVDAVQSRRVLLQLQKELKEATTTTSTSDDDTPSSMAQHVEFLAKRYQDLSRTSRIMARMMGQADADSLATAETLCAQEPRLPEPPGRFAGDHEYNHSMKSERVSRSNRSSLLHGVKKAVGNVFRRQSSREVNMKRIRKMQQRRMLEEQQHAPAPRPNEEFRKSFLEKLDYGEQ